jgi:ABC-2 type transport system ATP-binding protein
MSRYHNAVTLRTRDARGEALKEKFKTIEGVSRIAFTPASGSAPAAFTLFPDKGKVILPAVTRYLEQQKIAVDEVFTERGRVDEVFREVTQGHARS